MDREHRKRHILAVEAEVQVPSACSSPRVSVIIRPSLECVRNATLTTEALASFRMTVSLTGIGSQPVPGDMSSLWSFHPIVAASQGPDAALARRHGLLRWSLLLVGLTIFIRLPALVHPTAIDDESIASVVAFEIVDGGKPYINGIERKPPLFFWMYASVFALAGKYNWVALHATSILWVLLTMLGLYVAGRLLFDRTTGLVAALFYTIYEPWAYWKNVAFNGELVMNLPIAWAVLLVLRPSNSRVRPELLMAGALLCMGFLFKQPAAAAAVPLGIYLLLPSYRRKRRLDRSHSFLHATLLSAGFFGTLGLTVAILIRQGLFEESLRWTILDHDVPHGPTDPVFWMRGGLGLLAFVAACAPLVIGATLSIAGRWNRSEPLWKGQEPEFAALVGLLIASLVGTSASGRFYPHYFIQLVLPLSFLAAPVYMRVLSGQPPYRSWLLQRRTTIGWLVVTTIGFSVSYAVGLYAHRGACEAGVYIRTHSQADDRIFVWGQGVAPTIYLDAHRRPVSRYVTTFALTGYIFGSALSWNPSHDTSDRILPGSWDHLQEEFRAHPPRFIVDTDAVRKIPKYPVERFPVLHRLLTEHYELVYRAREGVIYGRRSPPTGEGMIRYRRLIPVRASQARPEAGVNPKCASQTTS